MIKIINLMQADGKAKNQQTSYAQNNDITAQKNNAKQHINNTLKKNNTQSKLGGYARKSNKFHQAESNENSHTDIKAANQLCENLTLTDLEITELYNLIERCLPKMYTKTQLEEMLASQNYLTLLCVDSGTFIGFIIVCIICTEVEIIAIGVDTLFRKKNIATKLVEMLILELSNLNIEKIFLEVRQSNTPALMLYRKFGFVNVNKRLNYYGDKENALVLIKELMG